MLRVSRSFQAEQEARNWYSKWMENRGVRNGTRPVLFLVLSERRREKKERTSRKSTCVTVNHVYNLSIIHLIPNDPAIVFLDYNEFSSWW